MKQIQDYFAPLVGEFELLVLLALVRLGNGAYGAAIRRELRERAGREASAGTVHMALARLEAKHMVVSYVGDPSPYRGGRRRHHYLIDTDGQRALGRGYRMILRMADGIERELTEL